MLGEFEIIERYFRRAATDTSVVLGNGDDAAVIEVAGCVAITVDTLVAGVHFPAQIAPRDLGYRALAVNLSDLAAMGSQPRWCTLALTLATVEEAWLEGFAAGFFELADAHGVSLIGGNIARGPLSITVTALGRSERDRLLTRSGGKPADDVWVTGTLGDAARGLASIEEPARETADGAARAVLEQRFFRPTPRIAEGLALSGLASAAIDVSDGLCADLGHICAASGCGATIDLERLPLSNELLAVTPREDALELAANGGDDYELCFTAPEGARGAVEQALAALGTRITRIGCLTAGAGVQCEYAGRSEAQQRTGYRHF